MTCEDRKYSDCLCAARGQAHVIKPLAARKIAAKGQINILEEELGILSDFNLKRARRKHERMGIAQRCFDVDVRWNGTSGSVGVRVTDAQQVKTQIMGYPRTR